LKRKGEKMTTRFPHLFSPLTVGSRVFKNRVVAAPIYCGVFGTIPFLSSVFFQAFSERSKGGCAQVTVGETPVDFEYANREPFEPIDYTVFDGPSFTALRRTADVIRGNGAVAMIELSHCGESKLFIPGLKNPIGPMGYVRDDGVEVLAMDRAMMQSVCSNFVTCATFMREAGFDGVMIHAGHGWLLNQFLSARTNSRDDEYGGSLANRARFPLEVIRSVRQAMGKDFLIEIRVSGDERVEGGMEVEEVAQFCGMLEGSVDLIHVSVGLYRDPILSGQFSSIFDPHGLNAELSAFIKKKVSIPVTLVGGINSPEQAEQLVAEGKCDFVALGRQLTADPAFVNKAEGGNEDDIAPCLRCYRCFPGPLEDVIDDLTTLFGCSVNPEAFYFDEKVLQSVPEASRKVLVVGGGIGGMEAAIVATDRGHNVTLVEKAGKLGGQLLFADTDAYKNDLGRFKDVLIRRVKGRRIETLLSKAVTPATINDFGADAIILAIGALPITPGIPGIEKAIKATSVYGNLDRIGQRVIMVGGGLVGCEVGLHLAKNGRKVTVIEMRDDVALDSYRMHRIGLMREIGQMLTYRTGLKCVEVREKGVEVVRADNIRESLSADTVVYAVGMAADRRAVEELHAAAGNVPVYEVGDCFSVGKVYDTIRQAFVAAMSIL
jgi:2,4-dienoyl-CoA reductase-like NADH-dependent reductase (Old Yellow Enzyme family)/NADPH-dependent 2,4-dienoyl-CoA reductase/sulfur reductase-like enzyme